MATSRLVFDGETFQVARRSLVATCKLFLEKPNLLNTRYQVLSQVSETNFRVFLAAIQGAKTEIGMRNAIDLESLSAEFQFVELGRQVSEFVSQHPHIEVIRLQSAILDLQRRLAGHDRKLCELNEANGRAMAEQASQLEGLRGAIGEVAEKLQHECKKVSGLQEAVGEMRRQISETEKAVERRVGPLERVVLGLAETKDRTSRVESDVAGLRAAMADNDAKVEEVRREVACQKAQLSDSCPKLNQDLKNLQQEHAKPQEEMRATRPKVSWRPAPLKPTKQFPPSMKKGTIQVVEGPGRYPTTLTIDIPDGIIAHLTQMCGGNVNDRGVVTVTSSAVYQGDRQWAARHSVDLHSDSAFASQCRDVAEDIPHTPNNWICFDFRERRVVPTHYTIRSKHDKRPKPNHLQHWVLELSDDAHEWVEIHRRENYSGIWGSNLTATFPVVGISGGRYVRLTNIGRNHFGDDCLIIAAFEIFGKLIE
jgi:predicted  nucleic acid-binding Zn-ribbon protein